MPKLPPGTHGYADIRIGDSIDAGTTTVSAEAIDRFAQLTGDRFEIHMSDRAAARHGFKGRVAHGLLILSLVDGLKNQAPAQLKARASLGWDWSFRAPVIAGDTISVTFTIREMRETKTPGQGILTLDFDVRNQDNTQVQSGRNKLLVYT